MNNNNALTRQGVRDLNSLGPRKSKGKKLELPPFLCPHNKRDLATDVDTNETICTACNSRWTRPFNTEE